MERGIYRGIFRSVLCSSGETDTDVDVDALGWTGIADQRNRAQRSVGHSSGDVSGGSMYRGAHLVTACIS